MSISRTRSDRLMEKHCVLGFWLAVQLCIAAYPLAEGVACQANPGEQC